MKQLAWVGLVLAATAGAPALAADLPVKAPPRVMAVDNWTGFYIGVNGGYSWGRASTDLVATQTTVGTITRTLLGGTVLDVTTVPGPITTASLSDRARMDGWLGGAQIGYNAKFNNWILGIEADFQGTGQRGGSSFCLAAACPLGSTLITSDFHLRWFGTLRGRAGLLADPNLLLYVTGGLAVGEIGADYSASITGTPGVLGTFSAKTTRAGFVVGGGAEYRISERWSFKLEYLYMDLGSVGASLTAAQTTLPLIVTVGDFRFIGTSTTTTTATANTRITDNLLRAGINLRF
jgi:outer membrane immunogenic protein